MVPIGLVFEDEFIRSISKSVHVWIRFGLHPALVWTCTSPVLISCSLDYHLTLLWDGASCTKRWKQVIQRSHIVILFMWHFISHSDEALIELNANFWCGWWKSKGGRVAVVPAVASGWQSLDCSTDERRDRDADIRSLRGEEIILLDQDEPMKTHVDPLLMCQVLTSPLVGTVCFLEDVNTANHTP